MLDEETKARIAIHENIEFFKEVLLTPDIKIGEKLKQTLEKQIELGEKYLISSSH